MSTPGLYSSKGKTWPFAGLGGAHALSPAQGRRLQGIIFDVDGTLCLPQNYMFAEMRQALGITKPTDILAHIQSLPAAEQDAAHEAIRAIERRAMAKQKPQPGLQELMAYLEARGVRRGICTRNFDEPVNHLLRAFLAPVAGEEGESVGLVAGLRGFGPIVTRSFTPAKPSPAPLLWIAGEWGLEGEGRCADVVMVGDSMDDVLAGQRAGAVTVVLRSVEGAGQRDEVLEMADFVVDRLDGLVGVLEG